MDANKLGYALRLGMAFSNGKGLAYDMIDRNGAKHSEKNGQFVRKGYSDVSANIHKLVKQKGKKTTKGGLQKSEDIGSFPSPMKSRGDKYLKKFKNAKKFDTLLMRDIPHEECYKRSDTPIKYNGKRDKDSQPIFSWSIGGKELSPKEAFELEGALAELGASLAKNAQNRDVYVRPDLYSGRGQVSHAVNNVGKKVGDRSAETDYDNAMEKYKRVTSHFKEYDKLLDQFEKDIKAGKPEAMLAYFMHRTRCRAGSEENPRTGSFGATTINLSHLKIDGDNVVLDFQAKNGFWHVEVKDRLLKNWLVKRKKEILESGDKKTPLFGVDYDAESAYLAEASKKAKLTHRFMCHDFRRVQATQVAREYMDKHLKGIDPKDTEAYLNVAKDAVLEAGRALNDLASTALESYIVPKIFLKERPDLAVVYEKSLNGVGA